MGQERGFLGCQQEQWSEGEGLLQETFSEVLKELGTESIGHLSVLGQGWG